MGKTKREIVKEELNAEPLSNESEIELSNNVINEGETRVLDLGKKHRWTIFDELDIDEYAGIFKTVVYDKKNDIPIPKGSMYLAYKLLFCGLKIQTEPFLLKSQVGLRNREQRCYICNEVKAEVAKCSWIDFGFNKVTKQKYEKLFTIEAVCEDCLKKAKVVYMHKHEWLDLLNNVHHSAAYSERYDAKDQECVLCKDHQSDSTYVAVSYKGMLVTVPVCDRHFDEMVDLSKTISNVVVKNSRATLDEIDAILKEED